MASNHKLTGVIQGRRIVSVGAGTGLVTLVFDDGSHMTVRTGSAPPDQAPSGKIKGVRQSGTDLYLDTDAGETLHFQTAEPTSSVMVRDASGTLEYAD